MQNLTETRSPVSGWGFNLNMVPSGSWSSLDEVLETLAALGCSHVEVVARRHDLLVGGRVQHGRVARMRKAIEAAGLAPTFHSTHAINLMATDGFEIHLSTAEASIEIAAELGARAMVLHSGRIMNWDGDYSSPAVTRALEQERQALQVLGERAKRAGVVIAVENMIPRPWRHVLSYGADLTALAVQLAKVNHESVGACLDIGHAFLAATTRGTDVYTDIPVILPHVRHIHIHDNNGIQETITTGSAEDDLAMGIGDMHAPLGAGRIDWEKTCDLLSAAPRCVVINELSQRFGDQLAPTAETFSSWFQSLTKRWERNDRMPVQR